MKQNYFEIIVLYCLEKIKSERTIYSIFHLLKGKKSAQTIQDSHMYQLTSFFQLYPYVTRNRFDEAIRSLLSAGYLEELNDQYFILTDKGREQLHKNLKIYPIPKYLNGWKFHPQTDIFWKRLSLLVQVCSNLNHHHTQYMPVQKDKDIQLWLKKFIHHATLKKTEMAKCLYQELMLLLQDSKNILPSAFVIRLSGFEAFGLTATQASERLQLDGYYYEAQFTNVIHYMLERMQLKPTEIPFLCKIIEDIPMKEPLTKSTKRTFALIQKGYKIDEIALMRNLKRNTIEDHLVELAINLKDFDIHPYVNVEKQKKIMNAAKKASSRQLKQIRQFAQETSYFEIRLVLAKNGVEE
ncbi:helix-turn-helix domain-containing protein [Cytobacillus sp. Hz8]|uniref:helix-turn-helix domain-containing protein n=1 Tax=Cytobacillus sp. Hz8 TaxID=3347168 RepID=UPI0035D8703E